MPAMMNRFQFLHDAALYTTGASKAAWWHLASRFGRPEGFAAGIRARSLKARMLRGGLDRLEKRYRAADFMLTRVLHVRFPSLARSLCVYEYALRMGLLARLCVAESSEARANGRAWVEISGKPFMDGAEAPAKEMVFYEG